MNSAILHATLPVEDATACHLWRRTKGATQLFVVRFI